MRKWLWALALLLLSALPCQAQTGPGVVLNYAGYQPSEQAPYKSVTASWIVTSISYFGSATEANNYQWIGVGGFLTTGLIQTGTDCEILATGGPTCRCWYEWSNIVITACTGGSYPVTPGDLINASMACTARAPSTLRRTGP